MPPASQSVVGRVTSCSTSTRRILLALVRLGVGISLILYVVESKVIDLRALMKLVTAWPITIAAVALILLDTALMALRLHYLFRPCGMNLALGASFELTLIGSFFSTFLPGRAGGDLVKVLYASRKTSGRQTEIITILMFDRIIGLFSMLILPLLLAPFFPEVLRTAPAVHLLVMTAALLALVMLAAFLICVFKPSLVNRIAQGPRGFLRWRSIVGRSQDTISAYGCNPRTMAAAVGLSLLANLMMIAVTALGVAAVDSRGLAMKMALVIPLGNIVNALPLTPGGLGVGEAAFNTLFSMTGLRGGAEALLCWRIWTALVSLLGLALYLRGFRDRLFAAD